MGESLSHKMLERLMNWRKKSADVKKSEFIKPRLPGNYVARGRDYGDDIRDFEKKHDVQWENDPLQNRRIRT